ncbi:Kunitz/Bovine pancreatic trypsin inhibitor domain protein [Ancylostoma caninum]|uniref:Kunitz/Bovine pancreatic trypsin inhibitor domain protein n=1 Tax=Ancylostoma caninum TaxID=29170 RepID=A0A368G1W6_ANCCA|nr:Kunitz/Bovine pancreatic trypsin inhibitor domain protein [Ancylostoma caninum]
MKFFLVLLVCIAICEAVIPPGVSHSNEERCNTAIDNNGEKCAKEYKGFTFNTEANKCEQLATKLCRPPLNSFDTIDDCNKRCKK